MWSISNSSRIMSALLIFCFSLSSFAGSDVLVLYGSSNKSETKKWLTDFSKKSSPQYSFAKNYPKLIQSSDVKGLKPGFWIAIAGFCSDASSQSAAALEMSTLALKKVAPGTYTKKVEHLARQNECPLMEKGISLSSKNVEKDILAHAQKYLSDGNLDQTDYLVLYTLMLNPKNKDASDLGEKVMTLKAD